MKRILSLFSTASSQLLTQKSSTAWFASNGGDKRVFASRISINISRTNPVILPAISSVDTKRFTTVTCSSRVVPIGISNTKAVLAASSSLITSRQLPMQQSFGQLFASSGFRSTSFNREFVERTGAEEAASSEEQQHINGITRSDLRTGPVIRMIIQAYHFA
eukprot:GEZU01000534.1.p1 GENE.GEZU01000534.1~~GEZU01000534.1.p1  ORF type:complete len:162 (+),score=13.90 GEZU01000534.1:19-504(+)